MAEIDYNPAQQQGNIPVANPAVRPQIPVVVGNVVGAVPAGPYRPASPPPHYQPNFPANVLQNNNNNNFNRAYGAPRGRGAIRGNSRGRSPQRVVAPHAEPNALAHNDTKIHDVSIFVPNPLTKEAAIWYNNMTNSEIPYKDLPSGQNGNFSSMAHQTLIASALLDMTLITRVRADVIQVRLNRSFRRWAHFVDRCARPANNVKFEAVSESSPAHAILAVEDVDWQDIVTGVSTMRYQVAYVITAMYDGPFGVHTIGPNGQQLVAWKNTSSGVVAIHKPSSGIYTMVNPRTFLSELGMTNEVVELASLGPYKLFRINAGRPPKCALPIPVPQCEFYSIASLPSTWLGDWFPPMLAPLYYYLAFGAEQKVELIVHSHTLSSATPSLRTPNTLNLTTATMTVESALASAGYGLVATAWPEDHRSLVQDTTLGLLYGGRRQAARGLFSARVAHQHDIDLIMSAGATERPTTNRIAIFVRMLFISLLLSLAFTFIGRTTRSMSVQAANETFSDSAVVSQNYTNPPSLLMEFLSNWFLSFGIFALVFGVYVVHPLGVVPLVALSIMRLSSVNFFFGTNSALGAPTFPTGNPFEFGSAEYLEFAQNFAIGVEFGAVMLTFFLSCLTVASPSLKAIYAFLQCLAFYRFVLDGGCNDEVISGQMLAIAIPLLFLWVNDYLYFAANHVMTFLTIYHPFILRKVGFIVFLWLCGTAQASAGEVSRRDDLTWIVHIVLIVAMLHCYFMNKHKKTLRVKILNNNSLSQYISSIKMAEPYLPPGYYQMPEDFVVPSIITPLHLLRDAPKMRGTLKVNGMVVAPDEVPLPILAAYSKEVRPDDCYYPLVIPARVMFKPAAHTVSRYAAIRFRIARDPHPDDFDWATAIARMKQAAEVIATWFVPIDDIPTFEQSIESMPSDRKFVLRKFQLEVERGEQKRAHHGGCHPKLDETIWKAIPRAISTPPLEWSVLMMPYVRAITKRTKEIMNIRNCFTVRSPSLGDLVVRIVFASAHTLSELEHDMADAIARESIITIFIAGDDSIMFHHPKHGWIEGDYSQYDITQRSQCIETLITLFNALGVPKLVQELERACRRMSITTRVKDNVVISFSHDVGDAALSTGQFTTTWGNGMNNSCALVSMLLSGEEPVESARKCGFILKTRDLSKYPMGFTFLKTFFIFSEAPDLDGIRPLIGLPLPGMVWMKLGKVSTDPCKIFGVKRRRDAYRHMAYSISRSLVAIPLNTPLIGAFIRLLLRLTGSTTPTVAAQNFVESPHNPLYTAKDKQRPNLRKSESEQVYTFIENRYSISRDAVDCFERELDSIDCDFPLVISHPVIEALSSDYS